MRLARALIALLATAMAAAALGVPALAAGGGVEYNEVTVWVPPDYRGNLLVYIAPLNVSDPGLVSADSLYVIDQSGQPYYSFLFSSYPPIAVWADPAAGPRAFSIFYGGTNPYPSYIARPGGSVPLFAAFDDFSYDSGLWIYNGRHTLSAGNLILSANTTAMMNATYSSGAIALWLARLGTRGYEIDIRSDTNYTGWIVLNLSGTVFNDWSGIRDGKDIFFLDENYNPIEYKIYINKEKHLLYALLNTSVTTTIKHIYMYYGGSNPYISYLKDYKYLSNTEYIIKNVFGLREHQVDGYSPQVTFSIPSDGIVQISSSRNGHADVYMIIHLPRALLQGKKLRIKWNLYTSYTANGHALARLYVIDKNITRTDELPRKYIDQYLDDNSIKYVIAASYTLPRGPRSGWHGWYEDESDKLDLSSFTQDVVTVLIELQDYWIDSTNQLQVDYLEVVDPSTNSVVVRWDFNGWQLKMEKTGTTEDYGIVYDPNNPEITVLSVTDVSSLISGAKNVSIVNAKTVILPPPGFASGIVRFGWSGIWNNTDIDLSVTIVNGTAYLYAIVGSSNKAESVGTVSSPFCVVVGYDYIENLRLLRLYTVIAWSITQSNITITRYIYKSIQIDVPENVTASGLIPYVSTSSVSLVIDRFGVTLGDAISLMTRDLLLMRIAGPIPIGGIVRYVAVSTPISVKFEQGKVIVEPDPAARGIRLKGFRGWTLNLAVYGTSIQNIMITSDSYDVDFPLGFTAVIIVDVSGRAVSIISAAPPPSVMEGRASLEPGYHAPEIAPPPPRAAPGLAAPSTTVLAAALVALAVAAYRLGASVGAGLAVAGTVVVILAVALNWGPATLFLGLAALLAGWAYYMAQRYAGA